MPRPRINDPRYRAHLLKLWRHLRTEKFNTEAIGRKPTAQPRNIYRHGATFIRTFQRKNIAEGKFYVELSPSTHESPVAATVYAQNGSSLGRVKIGFNSNAVIVEFLKGDSNKLANEQFKKMMNAPWPHIVIKMIENHAREQGYQYILFRRPETTEVYERPTTGFEDAARHDMKVDETRREMLRLWGITAKQLHYKKINQEFKGKKL